jgi:hypothetical protein
MKTRVLLAALFCAASVIQAASDFDYGFDLNIDTDLHRIASTDFASTPGTMRTAAGVALLCFEFTGVPVLQKYIFFNRSPNSYTAFKFGEHESYLMDKSFHLVGTAIMTEFNYHLLKECFGLEDPVLAAGVTGLAFFTVLEYFDGIASTGFSTKDQIGNTLGALLGMLRLKYPSFPVYVRLGVEDSKRTMQWAQNGFSLKKYGTDYYSMTKSELIYVFDNNLYVGAALSKGVGKDNYSDRFGISFGYDILNGIEKKGDSAIYKMLGFGHRYTSLSICVTYWNR